MKSTAIIVAVIGIAFAATSAPSAFAQSSVPGSPSNPTKPKVTAVPPPPPGGRDRYTTRTRPPGPEADLRNARRPNVVDDLAGSPNQAHADLPPGPGTWHCASAHACAWLDSKCTKAGGGMSQNPDGTQTCTVN